jgi:hypothetical protein
LAQLNGVRDFQRLGNCWTSFICFAVVLSWCWASSECFALGHLLKLEVTFFLGRLCSGSGETPLQFGFRSPKEGEQGQREIFDLGDASEPVASPEKVRDARIRDCLWDGMEMEVRLPSGAVADCVSETRAIDIDRTQKWAEAKGQSVHYAEEAGKGAMIFLFCEAGDGDKLCHRRLKRLEATVARFRLPIQIPEFRERDVLDRCGPN